MRRVYLFTAFFPFYPGEYFLESELKTWQEYPEFDLVIVPQFAKNKQREINPTFRVDYGLSAGKKSFLKKLLFLPAIFFQPFFYREIGKLGGEWSFSKLFAAMKSAACVLLYKRAINKSFSLQREDLVYTYWFNEITYALALLKTKIGFKLISRVHGIDLYEERRKEFYQPLKRYFIGQPDLIASCSENGARYLKSRFKNSGLNIRVCRLGVIDRQIITLPSAEDCLAIVSNSALNEVKRVELIVASIAAFARRFFQIRVFWWHIGSGQLQNRVQEAARNEFSDLRNLTYYFLGEISNEQVFDFYKTQPIDLLINLSSSEGLPLSILEALSCAIPVVAPDVGGISEAVFDGVNGRLLSPSPSPEEVVQALERISFYKDEQIRSNARRVFLSNFEARNNYGQFIEILRNI